MSVRWLLIVAALLQSVAVVYALVLLRRQRSARAAWLLLLGGLASMLTWRVVVLLDIEIPAFFNPLIAIWGSTCMVFAMMLFSRAIARRMQVEGERDALLASERVARSELEKAARLKDELFGAVSHELRTPLTSILGWCSILKTKRTPEDIDRAITIIERNARAQERIVADLLDVTSIHAGNLRLERQVLSLDEPVSAALQSVQPAADARAVRLTLRCEGDAPRVSGDPERLQQVATNLLSNALKFSPRESEILVTLKATDTEALLVVTDQGHGIDPAFLPHIFQPFRQGHGGLSRRHGGLGLGLSIVENLARLHGGSVQAESTGPGSGATFTVRLPLSSESIAPPASEALIDDGALAGMRILLIDDEQDVRNAVTRMLSDIGANVVALESGAHVEAALVDQRPHVLVIDISMPGEDGYALLRRIRRLPEARGGSVPAVSLTAHAREEDRARAIATGFSDHLPKPVDLPRLTQSLRRVTEPGTLVASGAR